MTPFLPRLFFLSCVLVTVACQKQNSYEDVELSSAQESSCGFIQNSQGVRVSWEGRIPAEFVLDEKVPVQYRAEIVKAAEAWNKAAGKKLIHVSDAVVKSERWGIDRKNVIYWVDEPGTFVNSAQQAKSLLRWVGDGLVDVDILINALNWEFFVESTDSQKAIHLESLLVHEFGHALGLIHQSSTRSVMYMALGSLVIRNVPTEVPDLQGLGCEYL